MAWARHAAGSRRCGFALIAAIAILGYASQARATTCVSTFPVLRSAKVAGQVFDGQGHPIVGAKVTVRSAGDRVLEIGTDEQGFFEASGVAPGRGSVSVAAVSFAPVTIESHIDPAFPFQLLVVRLDVGSSCNGSACTVLLESPMPLSKAPACLDRSQWASEERKWASAIRALDRVAARCAAPDTAACADLARTAEKDRDARKREYAAKVLTDQPRLERLARDASDATVRATAVRALADQRLMAEVAERDPEDQVRVAAVEHLTDGALLADLAAGRQNPAVRAAAAGNPHFTDPSALALLATGDRSGNVRQAAVGNPSLADEALLARIAVADDADHVRSAAVARVSDPGLLRAIAENDLSPAVRGAAVVNPALSDPAFFARVVKADATQYVRERALGRISDPVLRQEVSAYARADTVAALTDAAQLAGIARSSKDPELREAAARRIASQPELIELLRRETVWRVRHTAVLNPALTDQAAIRDVATHDPAPGVRVVAALKLDDRSVAQRVFAEVVGSDGEGRWSWAELAVSRLEDQALLARIAESDDLAGLRRAAVRRLDGQLILSRIASTGDSPELRRIATAKLTDVKLLEQIAKTDGDWFVRRAAEDRLKELPDPR